VLEQTLTDFELIVVDDGSTDDTLERLARYEDPRMSVISLPVNSKIPTALNEGFARASGQYFTWTSADNWMLPGCLETLARGLDEHPEVGLVYAGHYEVGDREGVSIKEPFDPDRLFGGENIVGPCFMYRRTVAEEVGPYDPDCFGAEDYDMWLRIATRYPLLALRHVLYVYRYHHRTVTAQQSHSIAAARQRALGGAMAAARRCRGSPVAQHAEVAPDAQSRDAQRAMT
jgi:glycosyltransferase involved in cell wall biosynthesis